MVAASDSAKPKSSPKSIKFLFGGLAGYVKDKLLLKLVNGANNGGGFFSCFFFNYYYLLLCRSGLSDRPVSIKNWTDLWKLLYNIIWQPESIICTYKHTQVIPD